MKSLPEDYLSRGGIIYGIIKTERKCFGHGHYEDVDEIVSDKFFASKDAAEQYIEDENSKPYTDKTEKWLVGAKVKGFELV